MTETYKIITGKFHACVTPTMDKGSMCVTRENDRRLQKSHVKYDSRKFGLSNRLINILLLGRQAYPHGTACQTGLCLLIIITHLNLDQINFGKIKMLCIILQHSCTELKIIVNLYTKSLTKVNSF